MSRKHIHVDYCLNGGGACSKFCTCAHCCLAVCSVCGAYEGSLTTECPGEPVDFDRQEEVYKTDLDYTVQLGWHRIGGSMKTRAPLFEQAAPVTAQVQP